MANEHIAGYLARLAREADPQRPVYRTEEGQAAGLFYGARLASVFQPVIGAGGAQIGHSAYVRCHGDGAMELSPWQLFARAADDEGLVRLDRLCRTVHALNYFRVAAPAEQLFLAVEARLLVSVPDEHGRAFERVLTGLDVPTSRVTIVLPESVNDYPALMSPVIANYRYRGFRVAATYRGGDPQLLERLASYRPDFIKLRGTAPADELRVARAAGALTLHTQLETAEQIASARDAGADLLQGYALGRPAALHSAPDDARLLGSTPLI
jgi:EAL domain-containing protein (putative c-di-GMP-specific phosphodiesterase class I)